MQPVHGSCGEKQINGLRRQTLAVEACTASCDENVSKVEEITFGTWNESCEKKDKTIILGCLLRRS